MTVLHVRYEIDCIQRETYLCAQDEWEWWFYFMTGLALNAVLCTKHTASLPWYFP